MAFQTKPTTQAMPPGQCQLCGASGQSFPGSLLRTTDHKEETETLAVRRGTQDTRTTLKEGEAGAQHLWRNLLR